MNSKKFLIFRIVLIVISVFSLCFIDYYQKKMIKEEKSLIEEKKNEINEEIIIDAAKLYISNNNDYYVDLLKIENFEIRINTDDLVKTNLINNNDNFKGYVRIIGDEYSFISVKDFIVEKLNSKDYSTNPNNEKEAYDLKYIYKGDNPNNYIKKDGKLYRIIGITNSNNLKVISIENTIIEKWGTSGNINYLKSSDDETVEDGYKGIFYVGYVRSETKDISSIIKNEKRNNTYTVGNPKYIGIFSYVNLSDIINASDKCEFEKITDINKDNCTSYLLNMLSNSYTSTSLENEMVYKISDKSSVVTSKLEKDINIKKVIYISGYNHYLSGNGTIDNPYEFN